MTRVDVAVVGGGLAGLVAAARLQAAGRSVVVLDKGRAPGGRCATRTVGRGAADTGAQFFTVRGDTFEELVASWRDQGLGVRRWAGGWARAEHVDAGPGAAISGEDGHPRYAVEGGMKRIGLHLARGLRVRSGALVESVGRDTEGWVLGVRESPPVRAGAVVLTPPLPQTLALLHAGSVQLDEDLEARLRAHQYDPCIALVLGLDRPPSLPEPGGVQLASGPVTWLADNAAKGASSAPSLTVHAAPDYSLIHYGEDEESVARDLRAKVLPWLGGAQPVAWQLFRWRYSAPRRPEDVGALSVHGPEVDPRHPLVLAGDLYAGAKIEGAVTSGVAAADRVLAAA